MLQFISFENWKLGQKDIYVNVNYETKQAIQRCAYFRTFSAHVYLGK